MRGTSWPTRQVAPEAEFSYNRSGRMGRGSAGGKSETVPLACHGWVAPLIVLRPPLANVATVGKLVWRCQVALDCNRSRERQVSQRHGSAPGTG